MRRTFLEMALAAALLCTAAAHAEDVVYGPDGAPTVVQRKLYPMTGKWEAGVLFDVALNTPLVNQFGGVLLLTYHGNEWLDLGVEGLLHATGFSSLVLGENGIRVTARSRTPAPKGCSLEPYAGCRDEFANDSQLRAGGFGVVRLSPIYGKFDLASEVKIHFQAFVLGGAGVASVHRESVNLCAQSGTDACKNFQQEDAVKPVGQVGGGFRFYLGQKWSLVTEVRGYFFAALYKERNDLTVPSTGTPRRYLAGIATFDAGLSVLF